MVAKICAYFSVCVAFLTCVSVVCGAYKTKVLTILYTKVLGSFTDHSSQYTKTHTPYASRDKRPRPHPIFSCSPRLPKAVGAATFHTRTGISSPLCSVHVQLYTFKALHTSYIHHTCACIHVAVTFNLRKYVLETSPGSAAFHFAKICGMRSAKIMLKYLPVYALYTPLYTQHTHTHTLSHTRTHYPTSF